MLIEDTLMADVTAPNTHASPRQGDTDVQYYVEVFENDNPTLLKDDVNNFLASLQALPNNAVCLHDIKYSGAQEANNVVSYSAMVIYFTYG